MSTGTGRIPFGKNEVFHTITTDRLVLDGGGSSSLTSTGQIVLDSSDAALDAIRIIASDLAGGIDVDAGTGGIAVDTTGSLGLVSSRAAADAVRINASNAAGGIDVDAGTAGIAVDTTGGLSIDSTSTTVASNISTVGGAGVDLAIACVLGSVTITGGEVATDAVDIAGLGGVRIRSLMPTGVIQLGNTSATGGSLLTPSISSSSGAAAVPAAGSMIHEITTTGTGDALTLVNGTAGQRLRLIYVAEGAGADTAILTPTTLAGGATITFNALGDAADLVFGSTGGWYFMGGSAVVA